MVDVQREKDVEQLRRIARTQQIQIEHLLEVLQKQSAELDALKGNDGDLQQKLALLERMHARALEGEGLATKAKPSKKKRKKRRGHGPTEQVELPRETERYELDEADLICPSCGGELEDARGSRRALRDGRRRRGPLPPGRGRAAEIRVPLRRLRRDGARSGAGGRRRSLLAALRGEGRDRQVRRPRPPRATGAHPEAARREGDEPDPVGPGLGDQLVAPPGLRRALRPGARAERDRRRPDWVAEPRQEEREAVADVVHHHRGRGLPPHL